jgi:hypothetical protein
MFGVDVGMSAELGGSLVATLGNYIPGALCIRELFLSSLNGVHRETRSRGHMPKNLQRRLPRPRTICFERNLVDKFNFFGTTSKFFVPVHSGGILSLNKVHLTHLSRVAMRKLSRNGSRELECSLFDKISFSFSVVTLLRCRYIMTCSR